MVYEAVFGLASPSLSGRRRGDNVHLVAASSQPSRQTLGELRRTVDRRRVGVGADQDFHRGLSYREEESGTPARR